MPYNEQTIKDLFFSWAEVPAESLSVLKAAGSNRRYFRVSGGGKQAIATFGSDKQENQAFFAIGQYALQHGVNVPAIYGIAPDGFHYLQEDVGDTSLYDLLNIPEAPLLLKKTLEALAFMQVEGMKDFDYSQCYPVNTFDRRSLFWDLNYFKYNFLKFIKPDFNEARLEDDFNRLANTLLLADCSFFMYRDFQSRNVMIQDGKPCFIDFQGGRRGPLAYDVASFLFQARANFSEEMRLKLLEHYLDTLEQLTTIDRRNFIEQWYAFAFFKGLQNLGTYGYRGLFEQKALFTQSIPQALTNLCTLIETHKVATLSCDYLFELLQEVKLKVQGMPCETVNTTPALTVTITSFSYKEGYPQDYSGNGGGYVFDCRGLSNPGRAPEFRHLTGRDQPVIDYLEKESALTVFLTAIFATLAISVDNYLDRGFPHLSVAFGCTGGQHRSVYCAEKTARYLVQQYKVNVHLVHREQHIEEFIIPEV